MKLNTQVTDSVDFFQGNDPHDLVESYGSPLYVYNERIFRGKCRDVVNLCKYPLYSVNYAIKANTNLSLLRIAREEGLRADVCSPGEIEAAFAAGYTADELFYIGNNVSAEELKFVSERDILISVDSLALLDKLGRTVPGSRVAVRMNAGVGGGHHEKVVTGGNKTKFGIKPMDIPEIMEILERHKLRLVGINHHIGSQNMGELFLEGARGLCNIAHMFNDLEFIDFGGGLGIPHRKQAGETSPDLIALGSNLDIIMKEFVESYGKEIRFFFEPGKYVTAECGVLLGSVEATKDNGVTKFIGTDIGFSVLMRPVLYDAYHDIEVYRRNAVAALPGEEVVSIVGNICESGDYLAKDIKLPIITEGDVLGVLDAGAYGYSMSSQYNHRQRPAEVLIQLDGSVRLIRRRDTYTDMLHNMVGI